MTTYQDRISDFKRRHCIGNRNGNKVFKRGYEGAAQNRLTYDLANLSTKTADAEIQYDVLSLRNRSRHLVRESDYASRYIHAIVNNILKDEVGFSLQMKAVRPPDFKKPDDIANAKIEQAWKEWTKPINCTHNGEESFFEVLRLVLSCTPSDGGVMIQKIVDPKINEFGFALRLIEIDYLDHNNTQKLANGNRIVMGIERNPKGKVVAYHLLDQHPGDLLFGSSPRYSHRVPADEIIHYYVKERITQGIGVPWFAPAMLRLQHLKEYEKAELVAAREAAVKGGYFTSDRGDKYQGEDDGTNPPGTTINDFEIGQNDELPPGMSFVPYDPQHPMSQYGDFVKNSLFGISAGLNISYATLTGDLSNANYSSMRAGKIEEQEGYKKIQCHMIQHLCIPIFEAWLETAITNGAVNLPMSKFKLFNKPKFTGRRWPWVDPQKDINAALTAIDGGLSTRTKWTEEQGDDLEEVFATLAEERDLAESLELDFSTPGSAGKASEPADAEQMPDPNDATDSKDATGTDAQSGTQKTIDE